MNLPVITVMLQPPKGEKQNPEDKAKEKRVDGALRTFWSRKLAGKEVMIAYCLSKRRICCIPPSWRCASLVRCAPWRGEGRGVLASWKGFLGPGTRELFQRADARAWGGDNNIMSAPPALSVLEAPRLSAATPPEG